MLYEWKAGADMTVDDLIKILKSIDPSGMREVLVQSAGCCMYGHDIKSVGVGSEERDGVATYGESSAILIRC